MQDELGNIDVSAIDELRAIKDQQDTLGDWLEKMEAKRAKVSESVFERVRQDYEKRHTELEEKAQPLKEQAREEYSKLMAVIARLSETLAGVRLANEELEFRHELGEFDDDEYEKLAADSREQLEQSENDMAEAEKVKKQFTDAFHSEEDLLVEPAAPAAAEPFEQAPEPPDPAEDIDSEFGRLGPAVEPDEAAEPATSILGGMDIPLPELPMNEPGAQWELGEPGVDVSQSAAPERTEASPEEATAMLTMARLVSTADDGAEEVFPLNPGETGIGRSPENDIRIADGTVSRHHAKLVFDGDGYTVLDLDSENGVYVNHERVTERLLEDGDVIEIGPGTKLFVFRAQLD